MPSARNSATASASTNRGSPVRRRGGPGCSRSRRHGRPRRDWLVTRARSNGGGPCPAHACVRRGRASGWAAGAPARGAGARRSEGGTAPARRAWSDVRWHERCCIRAPGSTWARVRAHPAAYRGRRRRAPRRARPEGRMRSTGYGSRDARSAPAKKHAQGVRSGRDRRVLKLRTRADALENVDAPRVVPTRRGRQTTSRPFLRKQRVVGARGQI